MSKSFATKSVAYVGAWAAFALFFFSEDWTHERFSSGAAPFLPLLASRAVQACTWIFLAPVVLWLGRRFPFAESRRARHLLAHVGLSAACGLVPAILVWTLAPIPGA